MKIKLLIFFFAALFLFSSQIYAKESRANLIIIDLQGAKHVLTKDDFRRLQLDSVTVQDPVYNKRKRFAGYWLSDILALAGVQADSGVVWTFKAKDGYKASIAVNDILQSGAKAFVAIEDLDETEGWEKIQQGKELVSPGPYYIVWQFALEDVPPRIKLPWPYQVIEISVHKADGGLQKLLTDAHDKNDSVTRGYKVFQTNCIECHSLNLEGGAVGPELNIPKNILEYENRKFIKDFISDPSSFRASSRMPTFNSILTDQDIEDVLNYLSWIGKHKITGS